MSSPSISAPSATAADHDRAGGQRGARRGAAPRRDRVRDRRGRRRGRHAVQGALRAGRGVRPRADPRLADLGGRNHRTRGRRRDDGHAPGGRHHVRRLPDARHGPAREPGGEGALHVGRQADRAARSADDARRHAPLGRTAQPEPASVGCARARVEGRAAVDSLRREGPAQVGDPRRQPGRLHRGQDGLASDRRRAGGRVHRASRRRRGEAHGRGRDARRDELDGAPVPRGRRAARWRRDLGRGRRSPHAVAARHRDARRVGRRRPGERSSSTRDIAATASRRSSRP